MDKQKYKENAKKSIDEIFAKIDELEKKTESFKEKSKAEYEKNIAELKAKRAELQAKYKALENASDDKWEEVKSAFSSASDSFKEGFSKITSLFK